MSEGMNLLGLDTILDKLEQKLGSESMRPVVNKTLRNAAEKAEQGLKETFGSFADRGTTERQVVVGNVSWQDYHIPKVKVGIRRHQVGEGGTRWNIEHLNEFGFTNHGRFIRPRGFGKMQEQIDNFGDTYVKIAQEGLKELLE